MSTGNESEPGEAERVELARRIVAGGYSWEQTGTWLAKQAARYGRGYADDMAVRIGIEKARVGQAATGRRFALAQQRHLQPGGGRV